MFQALKNQPNGLLASQSHNTLRVMLQQQSIQWMGVAIHVKFARNLAFYINLNNTVARLGVAPAHIHTTSGRLRYWRNNGIYRLDQRLLARANHLSMPMTANLVTVFMLHNII